VRAVGVLTLHTFAFLSVWQKVSQTFEVQGVHADKDFRPFTKRRPPRVRRTGHDCGGHTSVYVGGHQYGSTYLVRQVPDALQRIHLVLIRQVDHTRGVFFQFLCAQRPRAFVAAQHLHFGSLVVHVLGGHIAPSQRLAVGDDVSRDVDDL